MPSIVFQQCINSLRSFAGHSTDALHKDKVRGIRGGFLADDGGMNQWEEDEGEEVDNDDDESDQSQSDDDEDLYI